MAKVIHFEHDGRELEVATQMAGDDVQIWIRENNRPLMLGVVVDLETASDARLRGQDAIVEAMKMAKADVQNGVVQLPPKKA